MVNVTDGPDVSQVLHTVEETSGHQLTVIVGHHLSI